MSIWNVYLLFYLVIAGFALPIFVLLFWVTFKDYRELRQLLRVHAPAALAQFDKPKH